MRQLFTLVMIIGFLWGTSKMIDYYNAVKARAEAGENYSSSKPKNAPVVLEGLPANLEGTLDAAQKQGPKALGQWLNYYGSQVSDPRKAAIELDYIVMIGMQDPAEARQLFKVIKARTPANSPIAQRIRQMQKTYE